MKVKNQLYYHIARTTVAQNYFDKNNKIEWDGTYYNQSTLDILDYEPKIGIEGLHNELNLIDALSYNQQLLSKHNIHDFTEFIRKTLVTTNRRFTELIFEEIRKENYKELPSRLNCMYLCHLKDVVAWYKIIASSNEKFSIYGFECNGEIHEGDSRWIDLDIVGHEQYQKNALNYWKGNRANENNRFEVLFKGTLLKVEKYDSIQELTEKKLIKNTFHLPSRQTGFILLAEYFDFDSQLHGIAHTYRVMINVAVLGTMLDSFRETRLALCAAFIHDMARKDDGTCEQHGDWAVESKLPLFKDFFLSIGIQSHEIDEIAMAVKLHSQNKELTSSHPYYKTVAILKDADALDRIRLGQNALDKNFLRFNKSKGLIDFAQKLFSNSLEIQEVNLKNLINNVKDELPELKKIDPLLLI